MASDIHDMYGFYLNIHIDAEETVAINYIYMQKYMYIYALMFITL